jgi:hypothetical protein
MTAARGGGASGTTTELPDNRPFDSAHGPEPRRAGVEGQSEIANRKSTVSGPRRPWAFCVI